MRVVAGWLSYKAFGDRPSRSWYIAYSLCIESCNLAQAYDQRTTVNCAGEYRDTVACGAVGRRQVGRAVRPTLTSRLLRLALVNSAVNGPPAVDLRSAVANIRSSRTDENNLYWQPNTVTKVKQKKHNACTALRSAEPTQHSLQNSKCWIKKNSGVLRIAEGVVVQSPQWGWIILEQK